MVPASIIESLVLVVPVESDMDTVLLGFTELLPGEDPRRWLVTFLDIEECATDLERWTVSPNSDRL